MISQDPFVSTFGIVPDGDTDYLPNIVRKATRTGFAIVPIAPGRKDPICTLTARQAKAADREAQEAAREAGERNWERKRHACGIAHAMTDPTVADRVVKRLVKTRGAINIGVEAGRSRMVLVDCDTREQMTGFLADWSHETGVDMSGRTPTVRTPGVVKTNEDGTENWIHKDGGHFWFTVPEGIELAELPGQGTMSAESGWVAFWRDHQGLVPPSSRPEGPYSITGQVEPAPEWLLDRIQLHAHSYAERRTRQTEKIHRDGDPIDIWSAETSWTDLLEPDGWTATGLPDRCGCPIWTRPGNPAHHKSATAHELGCTQFDTLGGHGPLHLWTTDHDLGGRTVTKLQWVAWRDHEGDTVAAMDELDLEPISEDDAEVEELLAQAEAPLDGTADDPPPTRVDDEDADDDEEVVEIEDEDDEETGEEATDATETGEQVPNAASPFPGLAERLQGLPKFVKKEAVRLATRQVADEMVAAWTAEKDATEGVEVRSGSLLGWADLLTRTVPPKYWRGRDLIQTEAAETALIDGSPNHG